MVLKGNLRKMSGTLNCKNEVEYHLHFEGEDIYLNDLVGQEIEIKYTGVINCISCGAITKKSYAQGYCFSCMQTAPEADECVLRPVLCKAHLGLARDMNWAKQHCLQPHYVYLANTGEVKVGVTRESQIPTRWIDQGASAAIKVCKTPNRHIAGLIEVFLMREFSDKTMWKKMVSDEINLKVDLCNLKIKALGLLPDELASYSHGEDTIQVFNYPVEKYPAHPQTVNLDSTKEVKGLLNGIKGQYLLFNDEKVVNIRRHTGYLIELTF